jgi:hypothetical protein
MVKTFDVSSLKYLDIMETSDRKYIYINCSEDTIKLFYWGNRCMEYIDIHEDDFEDFENEIMSVYRIETDKIPSLLTSVSPNLSLTEIYAYLLDKCPDFPAFYECIHDVAEQKEEVLTDIFEKAIDDNYDLLNKIGVDALHVSRVEIDGSKITIKIFNYS